MSDQQAIRDVYVNAYRDLWAMLSPNAVVTIDAARGFKVALHDRNQDIRIEVSAMALSDALASASRAYSVATGDPIEDGEMT